jgi:hypothetical protein
LKEQETVGVVIGVDSGASQIWQLMWETDQRATHKNDYPLPCLQDSAAVGL